MGIVPPASCTQRKARNMNVPDERPRPNILMIMADQLTARALGAYGNTFAHTPNIDNVAANGVTFDNFYCNSPICAASRASMMTGQYPYRIDVYDNGSELRASVPTFVHLLRQAGYQTMLSGKMHFIGPDQLHGFEERLTTDIYPASFAWTPDWEQGVPLNEGSNVKTLRDSGICRWNLQLSYDEEVGYQALGCLRREAKRLESHPAQPFFLCASFTHPHDPFVITPEWWNRYADDAITLPAISQVTETLHLYNQWLQFHHGVDAFPLTEEQVRDARHAYYGMVSYFDHKVGELVTELKRLGLYENTVILITSDHGEMLGEHGMWFKRTFYEESVHIPMIVGWQNVIPAGRHVTPVASLVDLFPTLCDLGAVPIEQLEPITLDGDSFYSLLFDDIPSWKDSATIEYCGEGVIRPMRALRSQHYKYVSVVTCDPLLFDLDDDPHETSNLSGAPQLKSLERDLAAKTLLGWDADLSEKIIRSQKQRHLLGAALATGIPTHWDYEAKPDRERRYIRNSTQGEKIQSRLPFVSHDLSEVHQS